VLHHEGAGLHRCPRKSSCLFPHDFASGVGYYGERLMPFCFPVVLPFFADIDFPVYFGVSLRSVFPIDQPSVGVPFPHGVGFFCASCVRFSSILGSTTSLCDLMRSRLFPLSYASIPLWFYISCHSRPVDRRRLAFELFWRSSVRRLFLGLLTDFRPLKKMNIV